jgi:hypothetical protein
VELRSNQDTLRCATSRGNLLLQICASDLSSNTTKASPSRPEPHGETLHLTAFFRERRRSAQYAPKVRPWAPYARSARPQSVHAADPNTTRLGQHGNPTGDELKQTEDTALRWELRARRKEGQGWCAAHLGVAVDDVEHTGGEEKLATVVEEEDGPRRSSTVRARFAHLAAKTLQREDAEGLRDDARERRLENEG